MWLYGYQLVECCCISICFFVINITTHTLHLYMYCTTMYNAVPLLHFSTAYRRYTKTTCNCHSCCTVDCLWICYFLLHLWRCLCCCVHCVDVFTLEQKVTTSKHPFVVRNWLYVCHTQSGYIKRNTGLLQCSVVTEAAAFVNCLQDTFVCTSRHFVWHWRLVKVCLIQPHQGWRNQSGCSGFGRTNILSSNITFLTKT